MLRADVRLGLIKLPELEEGWHTGYNDEAIDLVAPQAYGLSNRFGEPTSIAHFQRPSRPGCAPAARPVGRLLRKALPVVVPVSRTTTVTRSAFIAHGQGPAFSVREIPFSYAGS